jgi:hypothetical protein
MEEINKRRESYALYKASLYERQQMSYKALDDIADELHNRMEKAKVAKAMREFDASLVALSAYYAKKKEADDLYKQKYMDDEYAYMDAK